MESERNQALIIIDYRSFFFVLNSKALIEAMDIAQWYDSPFMDFCIKSFSNFLGFLWNSLSIGGKDYRFVNQTFQLHSSIKRYITLLFIS